MLGRPAPGRRLLDLVSRRRQHLPKVGTPQEERDAMHQEQRAVMANMGIRGKGAVFWIGAVVLIAIVVIAMVAWIWVT